MLFLSILTSQYFCCGASYYFINQYFLCFTYYTVDLIFVFTLLNIWCSRETRKSYSSWYSVLWYLLCSTIINLINIYLFNKPRNDFHRHCLAVLPSFSRNFVLSPLSIERGFINMEVNQLHLWRLKVSHSSMAHCCNLWEIFKCKLLNTAIVDLPSNLFLQSQFVMGSKPVSTKLWASFVFWNLWAGFFLFQ